MAKPHYRTVQSAIRISEKVFDYRQVFDAFAKSPLKELGIQFLDRKYWGVSKEAWQLILSFNGVDKERYKSERYDCDNFAMSLASTVAMRWDINGCGIVCDFSGGHAYCALIIAESDGSASIAVVEPQTDRFILKMDGMYSAENGYVIFT